MTAKGRAFRCQADKSNKNQSKAPISDSAVLTLEVRTMYNKKL